MPIFTPQMERQTLESLQAGRGIAAIMVFFVHFAVLPWGFVWNSGVDFFFVLSGFIMYYAHHTHFGNWAHLGRYLYRRFIRIYPLYWLIIGGYLGLHYVLGNRLQDFYQANTWGILQTVLLLPQHPLVVLTSWTLAYEVLFYLGLSIQFFGKYRWGFYLLFLLPMAGFLGWYPPTFYSHIFFLEALMGIGIFYFYQHQCLPLRVAQALFVVGLILLVLLPYLQVGSRFVIRGLPAGLIVWALVGWEKARKIRLPFVLIALGNASYFLYLSHPVVISVLSGFMPRSFWYTCVVPLAVIGFAVLGHYVIEKPLLNFLRNLSKKPTSHH